LLGHSWYLGEMDRDEANTKLTPYPVNTFLVRSRMSNGEQVGYALSLNTEEGVKHMKIEFAVLESGKSKVGQTGIKIEEIKVFIVISIQPVYYLFSERNFSSIVDLISYYSKNSLKECFSWLEATLLFPIGDVIIVKVLHDYNPDEDQKTKLPLLSLTKGEKV